jgi:tetratricopeptide (TPR) repeat protein
VSSRLVVAVAAGVVLLLIAWLGLRPPRAPVSAESERRLRTPSAVLVDSLIAAERVRRWQQAFSIASELGRREPRNPRYLLMLGQSWNNLAWGGVTFERERAPLRTSVARMRAFGHALALLDSASALTQDPRDYAQIRLKLGEIYETMGMPIDALVVYYDALQRVPRDSLLSLRTAWVLSELNDPLLTNDERRHSGRGSAP